MLTQIRTALINVAGVAGRLGGRRLGLGFGVIVNMTAAAIPLSVRRLDRLVQHAILLYATNDASPTAKALAVQIGRSRQTNLALTAHAMLLRMREVDEARAISSRLVNRIDTDHRRILASGEALASGNHLAALKSLGSQDLDGATGRSARLELLRHLGRIDDVLALADAELVGTEVAARHRFDSLWDLGQVSEALSAIDPVVTPELRSIDSLRRIRDGHRYLGRPDDLLLERLLPDPTESPNWLAFVLFEFDRINELVNLASTSTFIESLDPSGRLCVARAHYIRRDFDAAVRLLKPLRATNRRWDAEKLLARIELERGISVQTVNRRVRSRRPGEGFDEVAYLGLHQIGQHEEAFRVFLPDADRRRLVEVFGQRADFTCTDYVSRRLVLPQGGPGDEILMAAAYTKLAIRAEYTEAACDPRLYSLFSRSFPALTFHPCTRRMGQSSPGLCAPSQPERADHVLYDHLDRPLNAVAKMADRVVFGRSLGSLLSDQLPTAAYLVAEQTMVRAHHDRVVGGIGVVWRSEFVDAVRSIHYLTPDDLAPLVELGCPIICLQHDARADERKALRRIFGEMVVMLDDLDMRDDFETMAAVTASLKFVVGIGTTIVELAGALGTPTVTMHPNRIGAWRRRGATGDQWHRSMRTAITNDERRPSGVVDEALKIIRLNDGTQPLTT